MGKVGVYIVICREHHFMVCRLKWNAHHDSAISKEPVMGAQENTRVDYDDIPDAETQLHKKSEVRCCNCLLRN